jgi:hypothetical protein
MIGARPGRLSVRSVNEYRRRDTLAYLGLRYYFDSDAARSDYWAREVATNLILARKELPYFRTFHFKDIDGQGGVEHRPIFLPCANEALAEAALLEECARHPLAFANPPAVFSYSLDTKESASRIFRRYIHGLKGRQEHIAHACEDCPNGVLRYTDIKRFYPSIRMELAADVWHERCNTGHVSAHFYEVGAKLITDHASAAGQESKGILTGPVFSHLLGNLVLRRIDEDLSENLPVKYFRYVDDVVLVGERDDVRYSLGILEDRLHALGFDLHDEQSPKSIEVSTRDWLKGRDDFSQSVHGMTWSALIRDLKQFLLTNPEQDEALQLAFRRESLRIPVRDYSAVAHERSFLKNAIYRARKYWIRRQAQALSVDNFVRRALLLRKECESMFRSLLDGATELSGYDRKRRIPKLRYQAGRLIYLAEDNSLVRLASAAAGFPELYLYSQVMKAVASGAIDDLLLLGTNAAQAAAQPLLAAGKSCTIARPVNTRESEQGLAIFLFNGVPMRPPEALLPTNSEIVRFAASGADMDLMRNATPYIKEIACLHGLTTMPRHAEQLRTVFDEDEVLAMDAIEQFQQSASS